LQAGCQCLLIDFSFADFFKGDHFFNRRSINIQAVQNEKQPCDNIGGSFVAIQETVIAGKTETIILSKKYICHQDTKALRFFLLESLRLRGKILLILFVSFVYPVKHVLVPVSPGPALCNPFLVLFHRGVFVYPVKFM